MEAALAALTEKIDAFLNPIQVLGWRLAVISVALCFLYIIASPFFPDFHRENKGKVFAVLGACFMLNLVAELVGIFAGDGAATSVRPLIWEALS